MRWVSARVTGRTPCEVLNMMLRWVFFAILAVLLISWLFSMRLPWLEKLGWTKLNSNVTVRLFGRVWRVPVTYVVLLATAAYVGVRLV